MHKSLAPLAAASLAALLALAACGETEEPEVVGGMYDPSDAEAEADAPPADVELPPMRVRETTFRCADNSLVHVSFYTNDTQVGVRAGDATVETILANTAADAEEGEEPAEANGTPSYAGEGQTLTGASNASSIVYNGQTCNS